MVAKLKTQILFLLVFLIITLPGCISLAGDITPPPGSRSSPSLELEKPNPTEPPYEVLLPPEPPDPNNGAPLYLEQCSSCHGEKGLSDGPKTANLDESVPALGTLSIANQAKPNSWYRIITIGSNNSPMPSFPHLSVQERWDIVAYLFTLSAPPEVVSLGGTLFKDKCAGCHGNDGSTGALDLTSQTIMGDRSNQDLLSVISSGKGSMPAFDTLSSNQLQAIVVHLRQAAFLPYIRSLETDSRDDKLATSGDNSISSKPDGEASLPSEGGSVDQKDDVIDVTVHNLSDQELLPTLEVVLRGYDEMSETYSQTLKLTSGTVGQFKDVPMILGRLYFATIEHGNAAYGSNVITIDDGTISPSLEITYFQPTTNPAVLDVDRMHVFLDFIDQRTLEIYQLYIFSNPSNQVLVAEEIGETVIDFKIPQYASNMYIEENMQLAYQMIDNGFGITSIYPDADPYQTAFSYQIAYDYKELDLNIPIAMDVNALIVLAPSDGFKVKSDQLQEIGVRQYEGTSYKMFTGSGIQAGNLLHLSLSGYPGVNSGLQGKDGTTSLVIGLGGLGISLIVAGLHLRRQNKAKVVEWFDDIDIGLETISIDDLLDAIISLDDQYRTGQLPDEAYYQRRLFLKDILRTVVDKE
jgi:mono/diheme cytochrome c family protein